MLTPYGTEVVDTALKEDDNLLSLFTQNLVTFELRGDYYHSFERAESTEKLGRIAAEHSNITRDQLSAIQQILDEVRHGNVTISTLRGIPPTIERVLKNILLDQKIISQSQMTTTTLGGVIREFQSLIDQGNPIIQTDTIRYMNTFDRNSILHANITPNEEIRNALIHLMLNVLLKIYQDYIAFSIRSQ